MKALIEITEDIDIFEKVLKPETIGSEYERGSWSYEKKGNKLLIKVVAKDASAFRAIINSITKILSLHEKAGGIK
jgi:tRNA threonylcarbamoyladenosine modification (KEOPS) complex  Pcc1 subunit